VAIDEIPALADKYNVSPARIIIWEKEGRRMCQVCREPIIVAGYDKPTHVDFRTKSHEAR